ncbi:Crp/Fnr family transcriptional regulator [Kitasatospora sp. NPDC007106]|uniref:Crp/Fnr family transcriptional regulator n=1 Tax=Kitasatospora sp. NPDC007106 TaxID=3156914 RepID=UPI0033D88D77
MPEDRPVWPDRSFLGTLERTAEQDLLRAGRERVFRRGETILDHGDDSRHLVLLLSGLAKVVGSAAPGYESVLALRAGGDLLGEMAFLTGMPRSARVAAATVVRARVVPADAFTRFLAAHPAAATAVAETVTHRLRAANERRAEFGALAAPARIAHTLADVADVYGPTPGTGWVVGPECTQADLASLASVSVRTVEKVLRVLEERGLVERRRRALVVKDPRSLRGAQG